jgi:hypothetical protein
MDTVQNCDSYINVTSSQNYGTWDIFLTWDMKFHEPSVRNRTAFVARHDSRLNTEMLFHATVNEVTAWGEDGAHFAASLSLWPGRDEPVAKQMETGRTHFMPKEAFNRSRYFPTAFAMLDSIQQKGMPLTASYLRLPAWRTAAHVSEPPSVTARIRPRVRRTCCNGKNMARTLKRGHEGSCGWGHASPVYLTHLSLVYESFQICCSHLGIDRKIRIGVRISATRHLERRV